MSKTKDELSTEGTNEEIANRIAESTRSDASSGDRLEHTAGGATTRDDLNDAGVPMVAGGDHDGPEDALAEGPTRGDYSGRVPGNPHTTVALPDGGEPIYDDDGNVVDYKPRSALVAQKPTA